MKIAVIGSGISGLSSAYFLSKKFKVDLYEKADHFGGHSYTYDIKEGDKIRVKDSPENLKLFEDSLDAKLNTDRNSSVGDLQEKTIQVGSEEVLAEIAIALGSVLDQTSLTKTNLQEEHQITVLALHRAGKEIWQKGADMKDIELAVGDILLIQGDRKSVTELKQSVEFLVLDSTTDLPKTEKSTTALLIILDSSFKLNE